MQKCRAAPTKRGPRLATRTFKDGVSSRAHDTARECHFGSQVMGRRSENLFKRNDVMRAIKSARDAGVPVTGVEVVCKDGTVIKVLGPDAATANTNPWDEGLKDVADKKRPTKTLRVERRPR